jgi:cytidine deaminase
VNESALIEAAHAARVRAYAPYSNFTVGAAVLAASGQTYLGANIENASYGLTVCAERAAIFAAISAGERRVVAVAVATGATEVTPPCGACRQVIAEFGPDATIVTQGAGAVTARWLLRELLPHAFGPHNLVSESSDEVTPP